MLSTHLCPQAVHSLPRCVSVTLTPPRTSPPELSSTNKGRPHTSRGGHGLVSGPTAKILGNVTAVGPCAPAVGVASWRTVARRASLGGEILAAGGLQCEREEDLLDAHARTPRGARWPPAAVNRPPILPIRRSLMAEESSGGGHTEPGTCHAVGKRRSLAKQNKSGVSPQTALRGGKGPKRGPHRTAPMPHSPGTPPWGSAAVAPSSRQCAGWCSTPLSRSNTMR